jgi:hypothetical protein
MNKEKKMRKYKPTIICPDGVAEGGEPGCLTEAPKKDGRRRAPSLDEQEQAAFQTELKKLARGSR